MKQLALISGCIATLAFAAAPAPAAESPLGSQMEVVGKAYKALRSEQDPTKAAAIVHSAQDAVLKAAALTPETVTRIADPAEKAKAGAQYRLMMGRLFVTFCELEQAYLNGDKAKAAALMESLKSEKKAGHERFMDKDK